MIASRIKGALGRETRTNWPSVSISEYANMLAEMSYLGVSYTLPGEKQENVDSGLFESVVRTAYKANGPIFSLVACRMMLFAEARFQYRHMNGGRPGALFGNQSLAPLEQPWPGATTGDLLARMELFNCLGGNAYVVSLPDGQLRVLRPDWTTIVLGSNENDDVAAWDPEAVPIGYIYKPGGSRSSRPARMFFAEQVAHYAPNPDPEAMFRGMSWITPVVREIMGDKAATSHKLSFYERGATPNLMVKLDVQDLTKFKEWMELFRDEYEGVENAYKTMFLGAGADATVVGSDMQQLDFKLTQGAGETRIAAAAGVPPIIAGFSEGLQAATYSNYGHAKRRFADLTMRPLWRNAAGSLAKLVPVPSDAELWYDDRDIPALRADQQDAAKETNYKASASLSLVNAGYEPDSVRDAVESGDLSLLKHTGLPSVQTRPGITKSSSNGATAEEAVPQ